MTDVLVVLNKLGELENEVGKLYQWLSTVFADDEKAGAFFSKLSVDEKAHFDLVKYQERVVRKAPRDFAGVEVNLAALDKLVADITQFRKTSPSLRDAIRFALDVETEVAESYATTIMDQSNKNFAELTKSLTANSKEDHYKQLLRFAQSYD
jgi:rubrerythrin